MAALYARFPITAPQRVTGAGTEVYGTGWSGSYLGGGVWRFTVADATAAGSDPTDGAAVFVPLRDVLGGLIGVFTDKTVQGYIRTSVVGTPPSDGDDLVAWGGVSGSNDWTAGFMGGASYYRASRVTGPLRGTEANPPVWGGSGSPDALGGHYHDLTWISRGAGAPSTLTCSEPGGTAADSISGYAGTFATDSYLAIGCYNESLISGAKTIDVKVESYLFPPGT